MSVVHEAQGLLCQLVTPLGVFRHLKQGITLLYPSVKYREIHTSAVKYRNSDDREFLVL